ncbi:MAG TPA: FAD-dependent oxidoreductase [Xanthobacteraceae bacterium]|nr:FAD-dependent oxidoreductase [Xanthobacteraceae bacterium]
MAAIQRALIVGAGMAGMTLGSALKRCGIACEIVEIRPRLSEPGLGISLQGPALRALREIGVLDDCISRGFAQTFFKACDAEGNVTGTVELPRLLGPDYPATIGIMRQAVHDVLAAELNRLDVPIRFGTTASTLAQDDDGVDITFTDGTRERYDLVVGADGSNSTIREMTFGQQVRPRYTGQMNWRATVRRPPEVTGRYSYFGPTIKSGFNPVSEREMYIYLLQTMPERPRWRDDELPAILRGLLAEFGGILGQAREEVRNPEKIVCRPVFSMMMAPPWYRGRVALIGDAVHTTTPQLASGASIAIEDAVVLARCLRSEPSLGTALALFMQARYERCKMVVENSEQLGEWEKRPGTAEHLVPGLVAESYRALAQEA